MYGMHDRYGNLLALTGGGDEFGAHAVARPHPPGGQAREKSQKYCGNGIKPKSRCMVRNLGHLGGPHGFGGLLRLRGLRIHQRSLSSVSLVTTTLIILRVSYPALFRKKLSVSLAADEAVYDRHKEQGPHRGNQEASNHRPAQRRILFGALPNPE